MIRLIKEKDPYRWHKRFALFPRRVGDHRIWLQKYAWRELTPEEKPKINLERNLILMSSEWWEEWSLPNGYFVWKRHISFMMGDATSWHEPKLKLKVVS